MTPEQATAIYNFLYPQIEEEAKATRKVLAAVPNEKGDYKPHGMCMTALDLAGHIASVEPMFADGVVNGAFAMEGGPKFKNPAEVVAFYDKAVPEMLAKLKGLSGEQLAKPIQFFHMNFPGVVYLNFLIKHSVHHRGQLSSYLRPMGAKVPSIYGGSADEPFDVAAAQAG
jgi:uncharacterized damage-inducible protein DinB